jgi:predicted transcriptional regulator
MIENQRRTSQIVVAYVRKNLVSTDQIAGLISSVHSTLSGLGNKVVEDPPRVPAVTVRRSVRPDYIICIDCGHKGKMLKRHLQSKHGLSADQYKRRWNLPSDYPMTAPNYSERRSQFAKKIGLGRKPAQPTAASATTTEKPPRRRAASKVSTTPTKARLQKASTSKAKNTRPRKSSLRTARKPASARRAAIA